jgi:hypothetical protein
MSSDEDIIRKIAHSLWEKDKSRTSEENWYIAKELHNRSLMVPKEFVCYKDSEWELSRSDRRHVKDQWNILWVLSSQFTKLNIYINVDKYGELINDDDLYTNLWDELIVVSDTAATAISKTYIEILIDDKFYAKFPLPHYIYDIIISNISQFIKN